MLWQIPQSFPQLQANDVHVWRVSVAHHDKRFSEFSSFLDADEKQRAARFIVNHAAKNFVIARGALRFLLSSYLKTKPEQIIFHQNQYGKLYVDGSPLQFNISHSHDLILLVFALIKPVGIDVEFMREGNDFLDIAQKFFSQDEVTKIFALSCAQQNKAFFNCWTRKEAFIKGLGMGMFTSLDKFSVDVDCEKTGSVTVHYDSNSVPGIWNIEALDPADDYVGAVAVDAKDYVVKLCDF